MRRTSRLCNERRARPFASLSPTLHPPPRPPLALPAAGCADPTALSGTQPTHKLSWEGCLDADSALVWYGQRCGSKGRNTQWTGARRAGGSERCRRPGCLVSPYSCHAQLGSPRAHTSGLSKRRPCHCTLQAVPSVRHRPNPARDLAGVYAMQKATGLPIPGCHVHVTDSNVRRSRSTSSFMFGACGVAPTAARCAAQGTRDCFDTVKGPGPPLTCCHLACLAALQAWPWCQAAWVSQCSPASPDT